jgi:hypothetical protein
MQHAFDINLFKENPQIFFKQLNEEEEKESFSLLEYFIYKHDIKLEMKGLKKHSIAEILPKTVNEFKPLNREEIYAR